MVNMLDDHDLIGELPASNRLSRINNKGPADTIDGFGTYEDETQASPVFSHIGARGYFWFLLFQLFTTDAHDGTEPTPGSHVIKSMIVGAQHGPWIPFPSHSLIVYLGPKVHMLALDCRAERKLTEIVRKDTYDKCFGEVRKVQGVEQLVLLLGVPIGKSHSFRFACS